MSYWDHPLSLKQNRKLIMSKSDNNKKITLPSPSDDTSDAIMFSPSVKSETDQQNNITETTAVSSLPPSSSRQLQKQIHDSKILKQQKHQSSATTPSISKPPSSPIPLSFLSDDINNNNSIPLAANTLLPPSPIPSNIKSESNIKIESIPLSSSNTSDSLKALMKSLMKSLDETNKHIKDYMTNTDKHLDKLENDNSTINSSLKTYHNRFTSINESLEHFATTTALSNLENDFNDRLDTIEATIPDETELKDEIKDEINDDFEDYVKDKNILDDIKNLKQTNQLLQDQVKIILHNTNSPTSSSTFSTHSDDTLRICPILKANKRNIISLSLQII